MHSRGKSEWGVGENTCGKGRESWQVKRKQTISDNKKKGNYGLNCLRAGITQKRGRSWSWSSESGN